MRPLSTEGVGYAHWVLLDYGDVIVHVFETETRAYYELEKLWLDAPRIATGEEGGSRMRGAVAETDERRRS